MIFNIFSKKESRGGGAQANVYQYTTIPDDVRRQIILLSQRVIGHAGEDLSGNVHPVFYGHACTFLREEYGFFRLFDLLEAVDLKKITARPNFHVLANFFMFEERIERCLDVIEFASGEFLRQNNPTAIETLNARLREGGVGLQKENGLAIRVDQQFIHAEIIKFPLYFLGRKGFEGANNKFLQAHKKYRQGDYKGALIESAKTFVSVLKIILRKQGQNATERDTASVLLDKFFELSLLPSHLKKQITDLKSLLQGGAPNVRNKEAAHSQGEEIRQVPEYLAAYGLHQTASAILLIAKAHETAR
ncbi:MAG: hypothetical protein FJX33_13795 [Alphaproteobacteria bacterium]|nr:hypothetical protein [Alphaproteobacteria bacterium]